MKQPDKFDRETLRVFLILGGLTLALVFGLRWVLFAPVETRVLPTEVHSTRP